MRSELDNLESLARQVGEADPELAARARAEEHDPLREDVPAPYTVGEGAGGVSGENVGRVVPGVEEHRDDRGFV